MLFVACCRLPELGEDKQLEISVIIPENIVLLRSRVRVHVVVKSHCEEALEFVICQIGIPKGLRVERNALDQLKRFVISRCLAVVRMR